MMTQLDLFSQPQPAAKILAFPSIRMTSSIRFAAQRVIDAGSKRRGALDYQVGLLLVRYRSVGVSDGEARRHADAYRQAILAYILRLQALGYQDDPRGAA